ALVLRPPVVPPEDARGCAPALVEDKALGQHDAASDLVTGHRVLDRLHLQLGEIADLVAAPVSVDLEPDRRRVDATQLIGVDEDPHGPPSPPRRSASRASAWRSSARSS